MTESERHRQRMAHGWAFNSQPPSLPPADVRRPSSGDRAAPYVESSQHPPNYGYSPGPYPGQHPGPYPGPYAHPSHPHHPHHPLYRPPPPPPHGMQPHAMAQYRVPTDRPQPPMSYSGSRHSSPRDPQYDRGTHSPVISHLAGGPNRNDGHARMSSSTAVDHLVMGERRDSGSSAKHQSPQQEANGISDGRNGRRLLAGLAAGMASPEQSLRSSRGDPREPYDQGINQDNGHLQPGSIHQAQMQRHAAYAYSPIPPTQMADAELLTSMRYAQPQVC